MDVMQFGRIIPRIRVYETKLLDKPKIERMIDAHSADEALKVLQETEYSNHMSGAKKPEDYDNILSAELNRVFAVMYDICPDKRIVDLMALKYDYQNIKVLLKGKYLKQDFNDLLIPIGVIETENLKNAVENNALSDLPKIMKEGIEKAEAVFDSTKDPQMIDIVLDKYLFKELTELQKEIGDRFVSKYVNALADTTNLKTLLRVKKQNKSRDFLEEVLVEGGSIDKEKLLNMLNDAAENISSKLAYSDYAEFIKAGIEYYTKTGSVSLFEKLADNYIMTMMKDAKIIPFGVEPILAYIYAKETEIKIIRIAMVGKLNNISGDLIRERLRDMYV